MIHGYSRAMFFQTASQRIKQMAWYTISPKLAESLMAMAPCSLALILFSCSLLTGVTLNKTRNFQSNCVPSQRRQSLEFESLQHEGRHTLLGNIASHIPYILRHFWVDGFCRTFPTWISEMMSAHVWCFSIFPPQMRWTWVMWIRWSFSRLENWRHLNGWGGPLNGCWGMWKSIEVQPVLGINSISKVSLILHDFALYY